MNKYIHVVSDYDDVMALGFVYTKFHQLVFTITDNSLARKEIILSSDYVLYKTTNVKHPEESDIVTLWNRDLAGEIPTETLKELVDIIKMGNTRV